VSLFGAAGAPTCERGPPGAVADTNKTNKEKSMSTNHNKLALRKQSIRTLTASELRVVAGGETGNGTGGGNGTGNGGGTGGGNGTHTGTKIRLF
jgi:hypothetical protein